jgi:hypothetical protein
VPTEIGSLSVLSVAGFAGHLPELDRVARGQDPEALVQATDALLVRDGVVGPDVAELVAEARAVLLARRLERGAADASPLLAA